MATPSHSQGQGPTGDARMSGRRAARRSCDARPRITGRDEPFGGAVSSRAVRRTPGGRSGRGITVGRGDRSEFADFALARAAALHRAAYLIVGDAQLAQDLVQEALTKTYVAWPRLRDPQYAEAYCRKAITTTAISWFRRKGWDNERPTEHLPEDERGASGPVTGPETGLAQRDAVWQAL